MFQFIAFLLFSSACALNFPKPMIRGPTAPLENAGVFDQVVTAKGFQPVFLREAELKHGRIAMVSAITLPLVEQVSDKLGISFFQDYPQFVEVGLAVMFVSEFTSMILRWENPLVKPFTLKEDCQPGDFGLTIGATNTTIGDLMDKELNNGRLAMFGILGMIAQELVTQQQLF